MSDGKLSLEQINKIYNSIEKQLRSCHTKGIINKKDDNIILENEQNYSTYYPRKLGYLKKIKKKNNKQQINKKSMLSVLNEQSDTKKYRYRTNSENKKLYNSNKLVQKYEQIYDNIDRLNILDQKILNEQLIRKINMYSNKKKQLKSTNKISNYNNYNYTRQQLLLQLKYCKQIWKYCMMKVQLCPDIDPISNSQLKKQIAIIKLHLERINIDPTTNLRYKQLHEIMNKFIKVIQKQI